IHGVTDSIWSELDSSFNGTYTARQPMISSLRRNLQAEHLQRLIDLTMTNSGFGASARPISNLSLFKLRQLNEKIQKTLDDAGYRIDPYSLAHLTEAKVLIEEVLNAQYVRNLDDIRLRVTLPSFFFEPQGGEYPDH
ncbi:MAG: hypothetical protein V3W06_05845, partial [Acidimicrobiia bacterium]